MVKYYTISFPGEFGQHVVETWSEEQIIKSYYAYWTSMMIQNVAAPDLNPQSCIDDWRVVHWAEQTDQWGNKLQDELCSLSEAEEFAKKRNYNYGEK